jgi:hypothetical protein
MDKVEQEGLKLISDNWTGRQQWSGTHESHEPTSTTINLRTLAYRDPEPSEKELSAMLNAATGPDGFASPAADDSGQNPWRQPENVGYPVL